MRPLRLARSIAALEQQWTHPHIPQAMVKEQLVLDMLKRKRMTQTASRGQNAAYYRLAALAES